MACRDFRVGDPSRRRPSSPDGESWRRSRARPAIGRSPSGVREKLAATLVERREDVFLYRDLTTLRFDVPLTETLEDLEWRGVRKDPFLELCQELGFEGVQERPHKWQ